MASGGAQVEAAMLGACSGGGVATWHMAALADGAQAEAVAQAIESPAIAKKRSRFS